LCAEQEVALVGGGNSAGQAVVFLAGRARKVTLVARRPLDQTMSSYLVERIEGLPNVEVVIGCEVAALDGEPGDLAGVTIRQASDGLERRIPARFLFSFIGAEPNTDWLQNSGIQLESRGFVMTGDNVGEGRLPLETSRRGVFAIGDVRCDSVKRVAAAVGDGAQVVAAIHAYLAKAPVHGVASAGPVPVAATVS
jgi:thioredoxin reductase (NADPH)